MRGTRITAILAGLLLLQFLAGVAFRAFVYADMYIAPDAPYGISDLIEFALGCALLATGAVAILVAVALAAKGPRSNRVAATLLSALLLVLAVLLVPAHTAAAKWSAHHDLKGASMQSGQSSWRPAAAPESASLVPHLAWERGDA
jgi:hypothetical protein